MRLRIIALACALAACVSAAAPGIAGAAPQQNQGLTIHAAPLNIIAGEPVLIFGHLAGPGNAGQTITLWHRINGVMPVFRPIGRTTTDSTGRYEFTRPDGIVESNRSWYVVGPLATHSRTVHERVAALVSLAVDAPTGDTLHALVFSGHVTPGHTGGGVLLQQENGSGDDWHTLARTVIGQGSNFQFSHAWRVPGSYDVRVLFRGDARNTAAGSDPVSVIIQQTQVPDFTINTSDPVVTNQTPVTVSGILDQPGTTTPEPSTMVGLYEHLPRGGQFREVTTTMTGTDGSYQFPNLTSTANELYQVRTMAAPARTSAVLFEGVQDVLTFQSNAQTSTVGGQVTFSGTVSPDKTGHVIFLERFSPTDGDWHTVAVGFVAGGSTYRFTWTFGSPGSKEFRARITGGPANVGAASTPVTVVVSLPPLSSLPTS